MNMNPFRMLPLLLALALLAGCSGMDAKKGEAEGAAVEEGSSGGATTMAAGQRGEWTGNPLDNPDSPLYRRVVYFEFDSSDVGADYVGILRAHAGYLAANPTVKISLQGHADERGTREYNLALGERRALSVRRFLLAAGVSPSQVDYVSYGEESPADVGHNESAWAMNRRVEIVY